MQQRDQKTVAIVGAAGSVGMKACRAALDRGAKVIAIDRDQVRSSGIPEAAEYRSANVLEDDLADVLTGCDAVISTLGLFFSPKVAIDPPPLYTEGSARIVDGMRRQGITRLLVVSAAFVVPQRSLPLWFALTVVPALHAILEEMRGMETFVSSQDRLDWTIVRPGWLLDRPARGDILVNDELLARGAFRCREADAALFLAAAALDGSWSHRRPALGAPERRLDESPLALCGVIPVAAS